MVEIYYDGKNPFSGIAATPFVAFDEEFIDFGNTWNHVTNITLQGELTGKYLGRESYRELNRSLNKLISNFTGNFKTFNIKQSGYTIYNTNYTIVKSIEIEQNKWYGTMPFNIQLTAYNPEHFSENYGVLNPKDEITFSEEENNIIKYTRVISAQGIRNSDSPIENAKGWVIDRYNKQPGILPILVRDNPDIEFGIETRNETVDRFNGTYSLTETYTKNTFDDQQPRDISTEYTIDLSYDIDNPFIFATINGTVKPRELTGKYIKSSSSSSSAPRLDLKSGFRNLDLYGICNKAANDIYGRVLHPDHIYKSIEESQVSELLTFQARFTDREPILFNVEADATLVYKQDIKNCVSTVNYSVDLKSINPDLTKRWNDVKNYFKDLEPFQEAQKVYESKSACKTLSDIPVNESLTFDEDNQTIQYQVEFSDDEKYKNQSIANGTIKTINHSIEYTPCVNIFSPKTSAFTPREHNIQDLDVSPRAIVKISVFVEGVQVSNAEKQSRQNLIKNTAATELSKLFSNFKSQHAGTNYFLDDREANWSEDFTLNLTETWSFEGKVYKETY
jgi:hypothetical protein